MKKRMKIKVPRELPKERAPHLPTKRIDTKRDKLRRDRRAWRKQGGLE